MTDQYTITPPPELVRQWFDETDGVLDEFVQAFTTKAASWGADRELDACCEWAAEQDRGFDLELRAARRPKPRSLAEEATLELDDAAMRGDCVTTTEAMPVLRRALERLQELEDNQ